ncbi:capsular biosynthesis protein, partial [Halomonas sp. ND22Bw]|uniref:hypothetical protein n=1 Tax=Halomonas sp. ND22Bw TaxID=2054178 RepID=UPI000D2BD951
AAAVVDDLNLTRDPAFNPALRPTLLARLTGRVRPAPAPAVARQRVIEAVGRRLTVRRVGLTYSMAVGFTADEPAKAARIA